MSGNETLIIGGRRMPWWRLLLRGVRNCGLGIVVGWCALAVYYWKLPWWWVRVALAVATGVFGIWALGFAHERRWRWAFGGFFVLVLGGFIGRAASHEREWRPEVAVLPRAVVEGDRVRLTGVRDFDYRSAVDFTVRHIEREVSLAAVSGVDLFVSYWGSELTGHTFVSFRFDDAPPLCVSIEARPEVGEQFGAMPALFKQFELVYVVGEERDLVRVRTHHRKERVYLYPIRTSREGARRLFLAYVEAINRVADRPQWYHLFRNNCTLNIVRAANEAGRIPDFDYRLIVNGLVDRYLYETGVLDTSLPFAELRQRSLINDAALAADDGPDFSARIREGVSRMNAEAEERTIPRRN